MAQKSIDQRTAKELSEKPRVTLRMVAAYLFTRDPDLTDASLDAAFDALDAPHDRFTRKPAAHYRALWKQGRLPPPPEEDPRQW